MRIISGTARGQRLFTPAQSRGERKIRPTSDRVREAIFNIITDHLFECHVLDLFAGTGALGIEALSRGCAAAFFVDKNIEAINLIKRNLDKCGFLNRSTVYKHDLRKSSFFVKKAGPQKGFGLIFADPPYRQGFSSESLEIVSKADMLANDGLLIIEEAKEVRLPKTPGCLCLVDQRIYGDTAVSIFSKESGREMP